LGSTIGLSANRCFSGGQRLRTPSRMIWAPALHSVPV
jgi:hypothetical protein